MLMLAYHLGELRRRRRLSKQVRSVHVKDERDSLYPCASALPSSFLFGKAAVMYCKV